MNFDEFSKHYKLLREQLEAAWQVSKHAYSLRKDALVDLVAANSGAPFTVVIWDDLDLFGSIVEHFGLLGDIQGDNRLYYPTVLCTLTNGVTLCFQGHTVNPAQAVQIRGEIKALRQKLFPVSESEEQNDIPSI